ncbi:autophagy-related protein 18f isoform X2 [Cornus florida]|uniref:autophagy-related protein 18f isoform X2 n=1 Tax=Cornus florida TaxID=4283 RepID=UPI00289F4EBE|nr:autophagy-related protein 18f isoform X2 [Cornus florida]
MTSHIPFHKIKVCWAGFDKIEFEGDVTRQVLLLGYRYGFQVWDVEEADNVRNLVFRHDGPVSFMQILPKPVASKSYGDKFADSRPLLVICADGSFSGGGVDKDGLATPFNGNTQSCHDSVNGGFVPTVVWFYSLRSQSYKHYLEFRSVVYSVRCSSRVVAVLQAAQIHCFDAATLEREYTILTNPIVTGCPGSGGIGYGPLAVGPRWIAYSGSAVSVSNSGRVSPQHLTPSVSFPASASNGSLVAHYAKESSKQLAAGIVTLGDKGYKKLSRYYSELIPDSNNSPQTGSPRWKVNGTINGHLPDADNVGMVIVRDIVSKSVISQFRAHKSPISSLCFDPSGTLLVTASVQGHNINVFRIMPRPYGNSSGADSGASCVHLYRLQRGFTNAVIQDISFSDDSCWIMISSSRGTSHLFAISPSGGSVTFQSYDACSIGKNSGSCAMTKPGSQMLIQQNLCVSGPPITLSVVSRIRSGNNGWRSTVSGAAAAATGRMSSLSGTIASAFHNCKGKDLYMDSGSLKAKYHLLVFSPSGSVIQYALRISPALDSATVVSGLSAAYESATECDSRLVIEAIQKWNICQKHNRRERDDNTDIYGDNGNSDSSKVFPEGIEKEISVYPEVRGSIAKAKISAEEKHHMYISEAELQMHQARIPLWAKPEISFQSMMVDGLKIDGEDVLGGEIEIESIPTCMIEARPRDLVPVFDHFQAPNSQQAWVLALDSNNHGQLLHQRSENGGLLCKNGSDYLDYISNGGRTVAEHHNGIIGTGWDGLQMPTDTTKGFVYNSNCPKSNIRPELVNNRENSTEAQFKYVNNNREGLKMENQFEDQGDEFD